METLERELFDSLWYVAVDENMIVMPNRRLDDLLGEFNAALNQGASTDFDEAWNGYGQLMFDSLNAYLQAKRPARDKPGPRGLEYDQRVAAVCGDAPYLYRGPPLQFQVVEHVAVAVLPDRRPPVDVLTQSSGH